MRKLPLFTFINKMDRPSLEPLELLDTIEQTLKVKPSPVTWPIGVSETLNPRPLKTLQTLDCKPSKPLFLEIRWVSRVRNI
jgi:peptide subunit release factor RF-3